MNTSIKETSNALIDQESRDRFCLGVNENFSVIAPAGVGKTRAIVERIINLVQAAGDNLEEVASRLVVVTYTHKAAEEMRDRARLELMRTEASPRILALFSKIFFGTIHSFCLKLLKEQGHILGLPQGFKLAEDIDQLWFSFLRNRDIFTNRIDPTTAENLKRYGKIESVLSLARKLKPQETPEKKERILPCPQLNLDPILKFQPDGRNKKKIEDGKNSLIHWKQEVDRGELGMGIPSFGYGGKEFQQTWSNTTEPLWRWLGKASLELANQVAEDYLTYRIERGEITYNDMVVLAERLIKNPKTRGRLRSLGYRIILDEAQDTDPDQFLILLSLTNNGELTDWLTPEPGRFCMVGDPQQSIYSDRADLPTYLNIHEKLIESGKAEALAFTVTMRCDEAVVACANNIFPNLLHNHPNKGQVSYVPLAPRPWAGEGFVGKINLSNFENTENPKGLDPEALHLARWIANKGLNNLGIQDWKEVAMLCPRKQWLVDLSKALETFGINSQIHSKGDKKGENPAYAWSTALLTVASAPYNHFELYGVLREIFGISDHDIALYLEECGSPECLNLIEKPKGAGILPETLEKLHDIYQNSIKLPLRNKVEYWFNQTNLRGRLSILPNHDNAAFLKTIDDLLMQAAQAEFKGNSLAQWSESLRQNYEREASEESAKAGCVQLYTCHKAKGLEWPVVIIPYIFRKVSFPSHPYPRTYNPEGCQSIEASMEAHDANDAWETLSKKQKKLELERLLYVTATRARHTLLWVDDDAYYDKSDGSLAEMMQIRENEPNWSHWQELPECLAIQCPEKPHNNSAKAIQEGEIHTFNANSVESARNAAKNYIRRKTPSSLAQYQKRGSTPSPSFGTEYGNWWHTMMEKMPWEKDSSDWALHAQNHLEECPDPTRGKSEVEIFLKSEITQKLGTPDWDIHTEIPFIWGDKGSSGYDGYLDLLAYNPEEGTYLILDWKTDWIEFGQESEILATYSKQISIYLEAVKAITKGNVEAYLYSTRTGVLIDAKS